MADPAYIVDGVLTDGEAWVGIATTTLSVDTAVVTFTSTDDGQVGDWSQYMDLVAVIYARSTHGSADRSITNSLNNATGNPYEVQWLYGDGSSAAASLNTGSATMIIGRTTSAAAAANVFGAMTVHYFDINSGKYKSVISQYAADTDGSGNVGLNAGTWENQSAITEIDYSTSSNFLAGSTFSLFGILPRMVA